MDDPLDHAPLPKGEVAQEIKESATGQRKGTRNRSRKSGSSGKKSATKMLVDGAQEPEVKEVAPSATMKRRHYGVILSFLILVVLPSAMTWWYLENRAADQYASTTGFSVQKEDVGSAVDILGGITKLSSGTTSDTDILYEFIQSQKLVELVDARLDLRSMYSKPANDPVFALKAQASIEELVDYWNRMVNIFYDGGNGLIQLRIQAFSPEDARTIAQTIFEESSLMINRLSAIARQDATRYAQADLELAVARLKKTRQEITSFRNDAQIVDPNADIQAQMGLINTLQQQLAAALIELDLLRETTRPTDPRIEQAQRKIAVIETRISEERKKFSVGEDGTDSAFGTLVSEYEGLTVEREFAEQTYLAALATLNGARAEAQRQSRYLAAYVEPTLAETPQYPKRATIFGLVTLFIFIFWSILVLVSYSVKDRR